MKSVMRYQSQLLYRRSYKPRRAIRIRSAQRLHYRVPSSASVWGEAGTCERPVAQKQSARLITGRRRSVTCQDDHFSLSS